MIFRKFFSNRNEKIKVKMNKPIYLGFLILEISKTLMKKQRKNKIVLYKHR